MNFKPRRVALASLFLCLLAVGVAVERYRRSLSPKAIFTRGMIALENRDWREVSRAAELLSSNPQMVTERHLLKGIALLKAGNPSKAVKEFSVMQPEGDLRIPALLYGGEAFYQLNQFAQAQRLFATLAAEQPDHVEAHRWLAAIAFDLGNYDHAVDELDQVLRLAPDDYRPHQLKAYMLADVNRYRAAAEEYAQVVAADPPRQVLDEVLPAFARAQMQLREYAAALETLSRADPTAATLALESECRLSLGQQVQAWELIETAQEADPEDLEMFRVLGKLEFDAGRPAEALEPLRKVLARDPHNQECRSLLAQSLQQLGRSAEAQQERDRLAHSLELRAKLSELSKQVLDRERDAEVREELAALYRELGKPEIAAVWSKAAAACRQMNTQDPNPESNSAMSNPGEAEGRQP